MAMAFTESEFAQAKFFVCLSVANKLRIPNAEFESSQALQRRISSANPDLGQALSTFLSAYDRWYQFHLDVDAADMGGKLSTSQAAAHVRLVETRDATRAALLDALKIIDS
jgi:hypothetical protein